VKTETDLSSMSAEPPSGRQHKRNRDTARLFIVEGRQCLAVWNEDGTGDISPINTSPPMKEIKVESP
jgi:hypothetical protein